MENVTPNVFTHTRLRGSNPSFIVTSDGVVAIDTPQLPTRAVDWRREVEAHGPIRYLVNTEHHVDHIFGNYYFRGAGASSTTRACTTASWSPDPSSTRSTTPTRPSRPTIRRARPSSPPGRTTTENRTRARSSSPATSRCAWGATPSICCTRPATPRGQTTVHVPEERVAFTGDTLFSGCQTWLMTCDVDEWVAALERIRSLDVDYLVPGHGPVVTKGYLDVQRSHLLAWKSAVASAVAKGWSRAETVARVSFAAEFGPVDIGQEYMLEYIQTWNAGALWDKLTGSPPGGGMARPMDPRDPAHAPDRR